MKTNSLLKTVGSIILGIFITSCDQIYKQQIDTNIYLPMGRDGDGCMRYRSKATEKMSTQVIVYQTMAGKYTPNKNTSDCR